MNTFLKILFLVIAVTFSLSAQRDSFPAPFPGNKVSPKLNSLNLNPVSAIFGMVSGNYEHLFWLRHGLMVEGGTSFGNNYDISIAYRYHYFPEEEHHDLISPCWGFFIHKGRSSSKMEDPDTKIKHKLEIELLLVGIHWGERFAWGETFNYAWRIGYGYPVTMHFKWPDGKPGNAKTIEGITRILGGLDSELSIGIVF